MDVFKEGIPDSSFQLYVDQLCSLRLTHQNNKPQFIAANFLKSLCYYIVYCLIGGPNNRFFPSEL